MSADRNRADTLVFQAVCGWQVLKTQLICKMRKEEGGKKKEQQQKIFKVSVSSILKGWKFQSWGKIQQSSSFPIVN